MQRIDVVQFDTAVAANLLAGTPLATIPGNGLLRLYAASTVNTATINIGRNKGDSPTGGVAQSVILRAGPEVRAYDPHWEMAVREGETVTIELGGTTGTVVSWVSYVGE